MAGEDYDHIFKLLLIGDAGVGKSSILLRYTDNTFDEHLQSTIGVDFKVKVAVKEGKKIKLTIWDTAGQERYRSLAPMYYRGAKIAIIVYDITCRDSYKGAMSWIAEIKRKGNPECVIALVGNK